jgi:hypothetical protein
MSFVFNDISIIKKKKFISQHSNFVLFLFLYALHGAIRSRFVGRKVQQHLHLDPCPSITNYIPSYLIKLKFENNYSFHQPR